MKVNSIHNLLYEPNIYNDKPNTIDDSPTNTRVEKEIMTWFWNKSDYETDSNKKENDIGNVNKKNLEK